MDKFLKTWGERTKTRAQYSVDATSSSRGKDRAGVALAISRGLISADKGKNIINIESGLGMIALAVIISSEVGDGYLLFVVKTKLIYLPKNGGVFPEMATDVKSVLRRFLTYLLFFILLLNVMKNLVRSNGPAAV